MIPNKISNAVQSLDIEQIVATTVGLGMTGRMAVVRCKNFRCLAIFGMDGVWRDTHGNRLDVIEVMLEF
jgi:hypothetical protein